MLGVRETGPRRFFGDMSSVFSTLYFFYLINLFIYLFVCLFIYLFLAALGLRCCPRASTLCCGAWASKRTGFSSCGTWAQ